MSSKLVDKPLTEVELEVMRIIWQLGECTIREVHDAFPKERDLAYTTIATMMTILTQKKFISSRKQDRANVFSPRFQKSEYEALSVRHIADNLFDGDSTSMMIRLLDQSDLSADEIKKIRKILDERIKS